MRWQLMGLLVAGLLQTGSPTQLQLNCPSNEWLIANGDLRACCVQSPVIPGKEKGQCQSSSCRVFGYKNSARANCPGDARCADCDCVKATDCIDKGDVHCFSRATTKVGRPSGSCKLEGELCLIDGISSNFKICTDPDGGSCEPNGCPLNAHLEYVNDKETCVCDDVPPGQEANAPNGGYYEFSSGPPIICLPCPSNSTWNNVSKKCDCDAGFFSVNKPWEPLICRKEAQCGNPTLYPCVILESGSIGLYKQFRKKSLVKVGEVVVQQTAASLTGIKVRLTFNIFPASDFDLPDYGNILGNPNGNPNADKSKHNRLEDWTLSFKKILFRVSTQSRSNNGWGKGFITQVFDKPADPNAPVQSWFSDEIELPYTCEQGSGALFVAARAFMYGGKNGRGVIHAATDGDGIWDHNKPKHDASLPIRCETREDCPALCSKVCPGAHEACLYDDEADQETCDCATGYERDAGTGLCKNVNECDQSPPICGDNADCHDTEGSHYCTCHDEFIWSDTMGACARACLVVGRTALVSRDSGSFSRVGTVEVLMNLVGGVPQFNVKLTLGLDISGVQRYLKSLRWELSATRPKGHAYGSYAYRAGPFQAADAKKDYLTAAPVTVPGFNPDCMEISTLWLALRVTYWNGATSGGTAWAHGYKTGDTRAEHVELYFACFDGSTCPIENTCPTCSDNAVCTYDPSSSAVATCTCLPGYTGDDCTTDIDECALAVSTGRSACEADSGAICVNVPGTFNCNCPKGWYVDSWGGCLSSRPRSVEEDVTPTTPASPACSAPGWVWIAIGILMTGWAVAIATIFLQSFLVHRRKEVPFFSVEQGEGDSRLDCPVPPPSTNVAYVSPSNLRRRPESSTPKATSHGVTSPGGYNPLTGH